MYNTVFKLNQVYLISMILGSKERPGAPGGGRYLVNCVPMREQRTAKLTLNSVSDNLKSIPLFTVSSQKVALSNVVN